MFPLDLDRDLARDRWVLYPLNTDLRALLRMEENPEGKTTRHWLWKEKDLSHAAQSCCSSQDWNPGWSVKRWTCYHGLRLGLNLDTSLHVTKYTGFVFILLIQLCEFYERVSGARMHAAYVRPGGVDRVRLHSHSSKANTKAIFSFTFVTAPYEL